MYVTTEMIKKIEDKINNGKSLKRGESIFHQGQIGLLKNGVKIILTESEMIEWVKCKLDLLYFIENYGIKFDPNVGKWFKLNLLHGYQTKWINTYKENRFNIFLNSRQMGWTNISSLIKIWEMVFNNKSILDISNKLDTSQELMDKLRDIYIQLPYFIKKPIINFSLRNVSLEGGGMITNKIDKNLTLGRNYDIIEVNECFHIRLESKIRLLSGVIPIISSIKDSRLTLVGQPNGFCPLYELVNSNNIFKTCRTYWWEHPLRNEEWSKEIIKMIGQESFDQEYNLLFKAKK